VDLAAEAASLGRFADPEGNVVGLWIPRAGTTR
jgi:hypothetical protein